MMLHDGGYYFYKILFIHDRERERERERACAQTVGGAEREGEGGSLLNIEPKSGLNPRTLGS